LVSHFIRKKKVILVLVVEVAMDVAVEDEMARAEREK
jgi:hypothetical protein